MSSMLLESALWGYFLWLAEYDPSWTITAAQIAAFYHEHVRLGRQLSEITKDLGLPCWNE